MSMARSTPLYNVSAHLCCSCLQLLYPILIITIVMYGALFATYCGSSRRPLALPCTLLTPAFNEDYLRQFKYTVLDRFRDSIWEKVTVGKFGSFYELLTRRAQTLGIF